MRVVVTPLYGAFGRGPACVLLEAGGLRLLLDCGWGEGMEKAGTEGGGKEAEGKEGGRDGDGDGPADGPAADTPADGDSKPPTGLQAAIVAARTAHALLLSHADLDHLGGLAAVARALPPGAPVLGTTPVVRMGQASEWGEWVEGVGGSRLPAGQGS